MLFIDFPDSESVQTGKANARYSQCMSLHSDTGQNLSRVRRLDPIWYLGLIATAVIGSNFLHYAYRAAPFAKGQEISIWFMYALVGISFLLWIFSRSESKFTRNTHLVFSGLLALWAISICHDISEGGGFNWTAFLTPAVLILIWVKPPGRESAVRLTYFYASFLAFTIVLVHILDITGWRPYRADIVTRWLPMIPGLTQGIRWEGMFGDPNLGGYVGAFLITYGLTRSRWQMWLFASLGFLAVVLSESRAAWLAAIVGALLALVGKTLARRASGQSGKLTITAGIVSVVIPIVAFLILDPTMNGRTTIWGASFRLFEQDPVTGIGNAGYALAAAVGDMPSGNIDSHNIVVDSLVRNGVFAGVLALLVVLLISITSFQAFPSDRGQSAAIWFSFLVGAMTYTVVGWIYMDVQVMPLLLATILADTAISTRGLPSQEGLSKVNLTANFK